MEARTRGMEGRRGAPASSSNVVLPARTFRTADVARILHVPPARVRAIVRAGLCQPTRRGQALEFSFQDLVLLRTAHGLLKAEVPPRRVRRALRELARQLPADRPLTGVRIYADGRQVVVRDGRSAWQPDGGQSVFTFDVDDLRRKTGVVVPAVKRPARAPDPPQGSAKTAAVSFERAVTLEQVDVAAASAEYRRALQLDPDMSDAYINLGRLVHEGGDPVAAMQLYREALKRAPDDPIAHYDLALAYEDQGDTAAARQEYHRAIEIDPEFADAHFNLARLLDRMGQRSQAMSHLLAYKQLTDSP